METVRFVCTSDLHFSDKGIDDLREEKQNNLELIRQLHQEAPLSGVLVAGDLTEKGQDGVWFPGSPNEFGGLIKWKKAVEELTPVYLCRGNHDSYVSFPYIWRPVDFYLVLHHGWLSYSRFLAPRIILVVLGENPATGRSPGYLRRMLKDRRYWNCQFVLMWHFNLEGAYSDWWTTEQKECMREILHAHKERILMIVTGHIHRNWLGEFHDIPQIQVGGPGVTLCSWDGITLSVEFRES